MKKTYSNANIKDFFSEEKMKMFYKIAKWFIVSLYPIMMLTFALGDIEYGRSIVVIYTYGILSIAFLYGFIKKDYVLIFSPIMIWISIIIIFLLEITGFFNTFRDNRALYIFFTRIEEFSLVYTITDTFFDFVYLKPEPWFAIFGNLVIGVIMKIVYNKFNR